MRLDENGLIRPKQTRPNAVAYAIVALLIALSAWFENHRIQVEAQKKALQAEHDSSKTNRVPASTPGLSSVE